MWKSLHTLTDATLLIFLFLFFIFIIVISQIFNVFCIGINHFDQMLQFQRENLKQWTRYVQIMS